MLHARGPQISTFLGSTEVRPFQVGFPAELTSTWSASTGYSWKQLLLSGVTVAAESAPLTGTLAVTPDNDTSLASGTKGWLEPDPQSGGWFFSPVSSAVASAPTVLRLETFTSDATASGAESDLHSYTVPANTLAETNEALVAEFYGTLTHPGGGAVTLTLTLYYAGAVLATYARSITATSAFHLTVRYIRTGGSTARYALWYGDTDSGAVGYQTGGVADQGGGLSHANNNVIKITGTVATAGSVTAQAGFVEWRDNE